MRPTLFAVAGVALLCAAPAHAQDSFAWLEGCWASADGLSKEVWSGQEGGMLFGHAVTLGSGGPVESFEHLRIETSQDASVYVAYPNGGPPTRFAAVMIGPGRALFANPDHDFPQVIDYVREGDELVATISALDGEGRREHRMSRCPRGD